MAERVSEEGERRKAKLINALYLSVLAAAFMLIGIIFLPAPPPVQFDAASMTLQEVSADEAASERGGSGDVAQPPAMSPSGISMVTGAMPDMKLGEIAPPTRGRDGKLPVLSIQDAVSKAEGPLRALNRLYDKRYPSFKQFGVDWAGYGDLRQLDEQFMRDKDPVKFVRGLAKSKNFPAMVKKYAQDPAIQAFVMDAVKALPADVKSAATHYATKYSKEDSAIARVGQNVLSSLGLPTGWLTGGAAETPDAKHVMESLRKSNPTLDKFMENPEAQKVLQESQKNR